MKITILSHEKASCYTLEKGKKAIMIRITDPHSKEKDLNCSSNLIDILSLKFHDYTLEEYVDLNLHGSSFKLMSLEDATTIVSFFERYQNQPVDELIIHCEEGRRRSAGVAIGYYRFIGDLQGELDICNDRRYIPNDFVIELITAVLEREREANKKS